MLTSILVALVAILPALAASLSSRAPPDEGRSCGTYISEERILEAERHFEANKVVSNFSTESDLVRVWVRIGYFSFRS